MVKKQMKMWNDSFETVLTDLDRLSMLDFEETKPEIVQNSLEVKGRDGVLVGTSHYAPYQLIIRFFYRGSSTDDLNLMKTKLRGILFRRDAFYVWHSQMPGRKTACVAEDMAIEMLNDRDATITVTFQAYKGYSQSLQSTLDINFLNDNWQFEGGVISDNIQYKFNTKRFEVWNGSFMDIDPVQHLLNIRVRCDAPNGISITNHMTGEKFIYTGALTNSKSQTLEIIGVNPIIDNERVGANSNHEWVSLREGWNNFEIDGIGMTGDIEVSFEFDFLFR